MSAAHTPELLRSSFDCEGTNLELIYDEARQRFTVATRWLNLVHIQIDPPTNRVKRLALDRASAVFETVCVHGATKDVALRAKKAALGLFPSSCAIAAGYEKEVMRRVAKPKRAQS